MGERGGPSLCYHARMAHLLLIEAVSDRELAVERVLEQAGFQVTRHEPANELPDQNLSGIDAVVADAEVLDWTEVLHRLASVPLVIVDQNANVRQAVRAMKLGAADYLAGSAHARELIDSINEALSGSAQSGHGAGAPRTGGVSQPFPMIGSSSVMRELQSRIDKVAPTDATVLVLGELGTGKELVARALHAGSRRSRAPLITVNCAAIPEPLIERELFGHGDSVAAQSGGLLEAAGGGTLFFDEIGELPLTAQARLLHFLDANDAPTASIPGSEALNVRIVAASHLDLKQLAENGRFRDDLFYRLNVVSFVIPPLRNRDGDTLELADYVLSQVCGLLGKPRPELSASAREAIAAYRWPGNVRELENVIERAAILCDGSVIESGLLAIDIQAPEKSEEPKPTSENVSLEDYFVRFVRDNEIHLTETELAERLGISRKSLWERRQRLGIPRKKTQKRGPRRA